MSGATFGLTPEIVAEALRTIGYGVEPGRSGYGDPVLRSAVVGIGFEVWFADPLPNRPESFDGAILRVVCRLTDTCDLRFAFVNLWNAVRQFSRLFVTAETVILEMDLLACDVIDADRLRTRLEIWGRLVRQFVALLLAERLGSVDSTPNPAAA